MKKILLISSIVISFLFYSNICFAQVANYPHPQGSTFSPKTVQPVLPPVNSQAAAAAKNATSMENSSVEQAVTQTQNQVQGIINNPQTQQDLNAQTGSDTTFQPSGQQGGQTNPTFIPPTVHPAFPLP